MALQLKQSIRLTQSLTLTPHMQLGLKLLAMGKLELEHAIEQELEQNPLLEEAPDESLNEDWDAERDEKPGIDQTYSREQTLAEYLTWQIETGEFNVVEKEIAFRLLGEMNEDGYLELGSQTYLAEELGIYSSWLEVVRQKVGLLDPPGCLALSITECLLTQLKARDQANSLALTLIRDYFEELQQANYALIIRKLGVSQDQLRVALKLIGELEPVPGRRFKSAKDPLEASHVSPDVYAIKIDEEWTTFANDHGISRLRLSPYYTKQTSQFIKDRLKTATFFIRSVIQRNRTICRVTDSIIRFQQTWFNNAGPLVPLQLKDVAQDVGLHESTISRVTNGKFLMFERGFFELKFFFGAEVQKGSNLTAETVKDHIRKLIRSENQQSPLTDDDICEQLCLGGMMLARRTIAKYRAELGIPTANNRQSIHKTKQLFF